MSDNDLAGMRVGANERNRTVALSVERPRDGASFMIEMAPAAARALAERLIERADYIEEGSVS